jgi:cytochrome c5
MNRMLMVAAALSVLITACGNDEAPKMQQAEKAKPMAQAPAPMVEQEKPAEPMAEAPMTTEEPAAESMPAETAPAPAMAETPMAQADGDKGKQVYGMVCFACHDQAVAGAPKLGDKAAWGPRIAQGKEILVSHAINGFQGSSGVMPPKGGRMDLSDEDISAAVDYMVGQAQ